MEHGTLNCPIHWCSGLGMLVLGESWRGCEAVACLLTSPFSWPTPAELQEWKSEKSAKFAALISVCLPWFPAVRFEKLFRLMVFVPSKPPKVTAQLLFCFFGCAALLLVLHFSVPVNLIPSSSRSSSLCRLPCCCSAFCLFSLLFLCFLSPLIPQEEGVECCWSS